MTISEVLAHGETALPAPRQRYVRAVGPRLRRLLYVLFAVVALLGANAAYLSSITFLAWVTGQTYQNYFYQYMFLGHLVLGSAVDRSVPGVRYCSPAGGTQSAKSACGSYWLRALRLSLIGTDQWSVTDARCRLRPEAADGSRGGLLAARDRAPCWPVGSIGCTGLRARASSGGWGWDMPYS